MRFIEKLHHIGTADCGIDAAPELKTVLYAAPVPKSIHPTHDAARFLNARPRGDCFNVPAL